MRYKSYNFYSACKRFWLMGVCLWGVLSCKILFPEADEATEVHEELSRLSLMTGKKHALRVASPPGKDTYRFEVCHLDSEKVIVEDSCVNAIRITDKSRNALNLPLEFYLYQLDRAMPSEKGLEVLLQRQRALARFQDREALAAESFAVGIVGLVVGADALKKLMLGDRGTSHLPLGAQLFLAALITATSVLLMDVSLHQGELEVQSEEELENYRQQFFGALSRSKDADFPLIISKQPKKWLVVMENFDDIISDDDSLRVYVDDFHSYLQRFVSYLEIIGFIPTASGVMVSSLCLPAEAGKKAMRQLRMQSSQDPGLADCFAPKREEEP